MDRWIELTRLMQKWTFLSGTQFALVKMMCYLRSGLPNNELFPFEGHIAYPIQQCFGSMTLWYGSGCADPHFWITDPDSTPDPSLFVSDLCSAQTRTGKGLLEKPPAVKQFPTVESHLGVRASYATRRKRRYEANKYGWTQPLFRKARNHGIN